MTEEELLQRFSHHAPVGDQADRHAAVRGLARLFAEGIDTAIPECREKSLAMTKLEEAMMWANAAIAREPRP